MRNCNLFILFFLVLSTLSTTQAQKSPHREIMNHALDSFVKVMPYISSQEKFKNPKNAAVIKREMAALEKIFKAAQKDTLLQKDLFATTNAAILENLSLARMSFKSDNKNFSYLRMKETVHLCFHCHAQLPAEFTSSFYKGVNNLKREKFSSDLDYAQYLFLTRDFKGAKQAYQKTVEDSSKELLANNSKKKPNKTVKNLHQIEESLRQILLIFTKVERDVTGALDYFQKLDTKAFPLHQQKQIADWSQGLKNWASRTGDLTELKDNAGLKNFVDKKFSPMVNAGAADDIHTIDLLIGTGLLSNYVFLNTEDPDKAIALYYLGLLESSLSNTAFYSLAESYFRDCVLKYPAHPIAPKCYEEYEKNVTFGFTGSGGVNIPGDIKNDLKKLKALLDKEQPKK